MIFGSLGVMVGIRYFENYVGILLSAVLGWVVFTVPGAYLGALIGIHFR